MTSSFDTLYHSNYFQSQLNKFKNRHNNHWTGRINFVFSQLESINFNGTHVLDLGTSVGTYAFEFATRGYTVTGIDLSPDALNIAKSLANEDNLEIEYIQGDISKKQNLPEDKFDLIYAGDIIEHLEPDLLDLTIKNCYHWLKPGGVFMFHTVPTKYDVIFHKSLLWLFLVPFSFLKEDSFKIITKTLFRTLNTALKLCTGRSWTDREKESVHCNLQTKGSISKHLTDANFKIETLQLKIMEERFLKPIKLFFFGNKEYFQKDIYGVASKRS
jgi:2-polyprenyl-3-methyl-5-hydroxy-6-metoxy-1,4-benzoquinol methylase